MESDDAAQVRASIEQPEAFEGVFDRYYDTIWSYLGRLGGNSRADELAGEVFLQAFATRDRFDADRGSVRSWLYGIASNVLRMRLRSDARHRRALARAGSQRFAVHWPVEDAEDAIALRQHVASVEHALTRLSPPDREIIVLFACEELSYEEISSALGLRLGTVRSRLARARSRLRELVPAIGELPGDDNSHQSRDH